MRFTGDTTITPCVVLLTLVECGEQFIPKVGLFIVVSVWFLNYTLSISSIYTTATFVWISIFLMYLLAGYFVVMLNHTRLIQTEGGMRSNKVLL